MKKTFRLLLLCMTAILAITSCSRSTDELLSTVPADASTVAVVNIIDFAKKAGFTIENGELKMPEKLANRSIDSNTLKRLAGIADAVNLDHVVAFYASSGSPILTFTVSDEDALGKALEGNAQKSSTGGFTVYSSGRDAVLVKDGQGWMLQSTRPTEVITRILAEAKTESMLKADGLVDFLNTAGTARAVIDLSQFSKELKGQWGCMNLKLDGPSAMAEIQLMSADGKVNELNALQPLDTDFLRYIPAEANIAAALGASKGVDWDGIAVGATMIPGMRVGGMLDTLMPYLKKADGTVAIASTVDAANLDNSGSRLFVMIHMPQQEVDAAVQQVKQRFTSMGATASQGNEGITVLSAGPSRFYLGNVDGYLALSSWPLTPTHNNSLAPYFVNRCAGLVMLIPSLSPLMDGARFGADFNVEVQKSMLTVTLRLTGTNEPFVATLLSLVP